MRTKLAILSLVLLCFAVAGYGDDWNRAYQVNGRPQLVVDADDGNVIVTRGNDNSVHLSVHSEGWRIAPGEIEISGQQQGNRVELTLRKHNTGLHVHFHTALEIRVTLPEGSDMDVHTRDGNLRVNGIHGTHKLRTGDGNAEVRGTEGSLDLETGDGNLDIDGRFDVLSLRTGDGNIDAVVRSGSTMKSAWTVRTGDGNIQIDLPSNFAADLDAHTGDGRVTCDFQVAGARESEERNDLRGKINGGGQVLSVRSGDGSIEIRR